MIKISQIKMPIRSNMAALENKICEILRVDKSRITYWQIEKRSIEARKREKLSYVYSVAVSLKNEKTIISRNKNKNVTLLNKAEYELPVYTGIHAEERPVIIGSGPAGLFCGYLLAAAGLKPLIIERGECVEERRRTVEHFWKTNELNTESNVQFGEGGAGTFSDGKLNTGVKDRQGRIEFVLKAFVQNGAAQDILYDSKPHVGTDVLYEVVRNLREKIIELGGEFLFKNAVRSFDIEEGNVRAVVLKDAERIETGICVAAIGHSARDTVQELYRLGADISAKAFAIGVRLQHPQEIINRSQWGEDHPKELGAAPYSLSVKTKDGRGVYSFCMCPGGYVVNASSESERLAVNGMSYSGRDSGYANSAIIVTVEPKDYLSFKKDMPEALSAIAFQRSLEEGAYKAGNGYIPVQRFEDFKNNRISSSNSFEPCTKGRWEYADVRNIFPMFIAEDIASGIDLMGGRIEHFNMDDALLMGVESRTSSPVRIIRDEDYESNIKGLYPCGEGAGYAGGIVSAAVDGMKVAEAIIKKLSSKKGTA